MLFDGTVTLDSDGNGEITFDGSAKLGHTLTITYDGVSYGGYFENSRSGSRIVGDDWEIIFGTNGTQMQFTMYSPPGVALSGEINLKVEQGDMPNLTTLYDGTVSLAATQMSGHDVMTGSCEISDMPENVPVYVYVGGDLKAASEDSAIQWMDGEYTNGLGPAGGTTYMYITSNLSLSSVDLKVAVPAS